MRSIFPCELDFNKTVSKDQVSKIKFALTLPAGSATDLGTVISNCEVPESGNLIWVGCTFDTKSAKARDYTTSIEINGESQLGATENITITK
jgi:hypothetical protein